MFFKKQKKQHCNKKVSFDSTFLIFKELWYILQFGYFKNLQIFGP